MKATLVSLTEPHLPSFPLLPKMTAEELLIYIARVSNPSNQLALDTAPKLIAYCLKKGHVSVFDMADMTIEVVTSRAISAQILRHWSFSFQEFSQRYAEVTEVEPIELRYQDAKNRQASGDLCNEPALDDVVRGAVEECLSAYEYLIRNGVSKETARFVLPMATQTTLYLKASVRDWIFYLLARCYAGAQKEHRQVAEACMPIFKQCFPVIHSTLCDPKTVEAILAEIRIHYHQAFKAEPVFVTPADDGSDTL